MAPTLQDIYSAIFERADQAFPELQLERFAGGWRSARKLDGSAPKTARRDKTVVTNQVPNRLLEQGGESLTFWDYIARREQLTDRSAVFKRLCELGGFDTSDELKFHREAKEAEKSIGAERLLEAAFQFFRMHLGLAGGAAVRTYLENKRGYSPEEIALMELGAVSAPGELRSFLQSLGFSQEDISEHLTLPAGVGDTHKLVIPLRCKGQLVSFSFRNLADQGPKYLNPRDFKKTHYLFNLPATSGEDLLLVEGELDALAVSVRAGLNAAAVKGSSLSEEQVTLLKASKPRRLLVCLDNDEAGSTGEKKIIERLKGESLRLAVVRLPEGLDPDALLREQGKEGLLNVIEHAERIETQLTGLDRSCRSFEDLEARISNRPDALKTGIAALDKSIRIPIGALTLIAGRPRHGKTTFLYNLMLSMAELYRDKKFYFFSYEESEADILLKLLNRLTAADLQYAGYASRYPEAITNLQILERYIKAKDHNAPEIEQGKKKLDELLRADRIQVVDEPYSVEDLHKHITEAHSRESIGAVFIDYIQRISTADRRNDIRAEIAHVSDQLRRLAVSTRLPLIIGAQFGREGVGRKSEDTEASKPALQALKEAGNLEEDANTVLRIWTAAAEKEEDGADSVPVEISVLKARSGNPNVTERLMFCRSQGRIDEAEERIKPRF